MKFWIFHSLQTSTVYIKYTTLSLHASMWAPTEKRLFISQKGINQFSNLLIFLYPPASEQLNIFSKKISNKTMVLFNWEAFFFVNFFHIFICLYIAHMFQTVILVNLVFQLNFLYLKVPPMRIGTIKRKPRLVVYMESLNYRYLILNRQQFQKCQLR